MTDAPNFAYPQAFRPGLPDPAPRFTGLPRYNFVYGHNAPEMVPAEALAEIADRRIREHGPLFALYNMGQGPQGFEGLRDFIASKAKRLRGIECTRDDIVITSGSLQALDLINNVMIAPGDTVIIEDFTYGGAVSKVKARGAKVVGAPLDADGIDMAALETILSDLKSKGVTPKYIYTIPTVQNPTGSIMPLERRQKLLELSREYDVPIFEDECYTDIIWTETPPAALYALDPSRVIHVGSFSKSLAPALRVGYIIADWAVLSRVLACKGDGGTGALQQILIADYFGEHFDRHIEDLTSALGGKLDTIVESLEQEFGTSVEIFRPKGGIFVWIKLPDEVDVRSFAAAALEKGVAFNPGPEWACDPESAKSYMRLCFALPTHEDIRDGIARLAQICFEHTGIPPRGGNIARS